MSKQIFPTSTSEFSLNGLEGCFSHLPNEFQLSRIPQHGASSFFSAWILSQHNSRSHLRVMSHHPAMTTTTEEKKVCESESEVDYNASAEATLPYLQPWIMKWLHKSSARSRWFVYRSISLLPENFFQMRSVCDEPGVELEGAGA